MSWLLLGGRFCIEFGAGTLAALAFVPPAPVGPPFYRLMSAIAAAPLIVGAWLLSSAGALATPVAAAIGASLVALPFFAWPTKGRGRRIALAVAIAGAATAVALGVAPSAGGSVAIGAIAVASALASGLVVGGIGTAMSLGHAYLTYPNLKIHHLVRVNRMTAFVLVAKAALVAATILFFASQLEPLDRTVGSMGGVLGLFARFAVGLAVPFAFALMVASCLRYQNTRSATGILYASTVLVLIGEALAMSLRGQAGGIPL